MTQIIASYSILFAFAYVALLILTSVIKSFVLTKGIYKNTTMGNHELSVSWGSFENDQYYWALVPFLNIYWKYKLLTKIEQLYSNDDAYDKIKRLDSKIHYTLKFRSDFRAILNSDRQAEAHEELKSGVAELVYWFPLLLLLVVFFM